ncbi:element excision factor XisH family protein [Nostoc sp. 'Lobaria pulmonaria (5183) cyanobiont']|uniref:element excision factor XisH family protein n=1 Tax=Nostoc sp. 'Lobaria pulmonaria (5183) cyanobiont' TaxID=1618022 RepID=UPI000CF305FC
MSAKDIFHESVKQALQKEQWTITSDRFKFKFGQVNFQIDLGAEKIIAAENSVMRSLLEQRTPLYSQANLHIIEREGDTPQDVAQRILEAIYNVLKTQVSH